MYFSTISMAIFNSKLFVHKRVYNYIPSEPTEIVHGIGDFPALASRHQQTTDRNLRNALRINDRFSERHPGQDIDRL